MAENVYIKLYIHEKNSHNTLWFKILAVCFKSNITEQCAMSFNATFFTIQYNTYLTVMIFRFSFSSLYYTYTFSWKQELIHLDKKTMATLWVFHAAVFSHNGDWNHRSLSPSSSIRCDSLSQGRDPYGRRVPHNARRWGKHKRRWVSSLHIAWPYVNTSIDNR